MVTLWDAAGTVGLILLLVAFVLNLRGRLAADAAAYHGLNAVGSALLAGYSVVIRAWVFLPLEVIWAVVALWALARDARSRGVRGTEGP